MSIWSHTVVKNEDRYIWYSLMSVIDYVDRMLVWDTGSTDKTIDIIRHIQKRFPKKLDFVEVGDVSIDEFTHVRQQMLEQTKSDWVLILDGDEVWWDDSIKRITDLINSHGHLFESIITRYVNVVGDIYHYQEEAAGKYSIDEHKGHVTIRAMNMSIPGLKVDKPHGQQGFFDKNGILIQYRDYNKRKYIPELGYMHFTHLPRSTRRESEANVPKRLMKYKHEIGISFPKDFYYPEVFFRERPEIVDSVWRKMDMQFFLSSLIQTPLRKIKRRIYEGKGGY
ncbi:MAG: glycosyltransferase [Patescibacteria group bacterium]|nr:glycosyltransferase [Patescibacteria group bacterium]